MPDPSTRLTSLADVARRAGVSVTTASRVLSRSPHPVAEGTRRRVLDAAAALDFEPNVFARGLVGQRTQIVGAVVHDVVDEWFARIVAGIEETAEKNGFSTLISATGLDAARELRVVRRLRALRVDAIVYAGSSACSGASGEELVRQLATVEAAGGALVRLAPHPTLPPDVAWSSRTAFDLVVGHLEGLGHREVAGVCGPAALGANRVALHALRRALDRRRLALPDDRVLVTPADRDGGRAAVPAVLGLLGSAAPPTAICCAHDAVAAGLVAGLRDHGVDVPGRVSVTGVGDLSVAADAAPGLTTVAVPLREIGAEAVKLAIWIHGGGARPPRHDLPVRLVVRGSTGPAQAARP